MKRLKNLLKRILCIRVLNVWVIRAARFLMPIVPLSTLHKIPFVGRVCVQLPNSKQVYLESDGRDMIATMLYWGGIDGFEKGTIRLFLHLLKHSETVFDVGANTGIYALMAGVDDRRRQVFGFEAVPKIAEYCETNVIINQLHGVHVVRGAVTDYDGETKLYVPAGAIPLSASTLRGFRPAASVLSVAAVTLDSFVADNNISKVDLLKIDTEGTEHRVLQGAVDTIKRDQPAIICEVLRGRTEEFLREALADLDYKYFWISGERLVEKKEIIGDDAHRDLDYLFVPKRRMKEFLDGIDLTRDVALEDVALEDVALEDVALEVEEDPASPTSRERPADERAAGRPDRSGGRIGRDRISPDSADSDPAELIFYGGLSPQAIFDEAQQLGIPAESLRDNAIRRRAMHSCLVKIRTATARAVAAQLDVAITPQQAQAIARNSLAPQVSPDPVPLDPPQRAIAEKLYAHAIQAALASHGESITDAEAQSNAREMVAAGERGLTRWQRLRRAVGWLP